MTDRKLQMAWEVLAKLNADPERAVLFMAENGVTVTPAEAARALAEGRSRNALKTVNARDLPSNFCHRVRR